MFSYFTVLKNETNIIAQLIPSSNGITEIEIHILSGVTFVFANKSSLEYIIVTEAIFSTTKEFVRKKNGKTYIHS